MKLKLLSLSLSLSWEKTLNESSKPNLTFNGHVLAYTSRNQQLKPTEQKCLGLPIK